MVEGLGDKLGAEEGREGGKEEFKVFHELETGWMEELDKPTLFATACSVTNQTS